MTCFRRVHITEATLMQLNNMFDVEPGNGGARDQYLADHKIKTYLILPRTEGTRGRRRSSLGVAMGAPRQRSPTKATKTIECWGADKPFANITEVTLAKNINLTSLAMIESNLFPNKKNCYDCGRWEGVNPCTLRFPDDKTEAGYRSRPDYDFKRYLIMALVLFIAMATIQLVSLPRRPVTVIAFCLVLLSLSLLAWAARPGSPSPTSSASPLETSLCLRVLVAAFVISILATTALISLLDLSPEPAVREEVSEAGDGPWKTNSSEARTSPEQAYPLMTEEQISLVVPAFLFSSTLSLAAVSVFLRLNFLLKLLFMLIVGASHLIVFFSFPIFQRFFLTHSERIPGVSWELKLTLLLLVLIALFHSLDRQVDFAARRDYMWRTKLKVEQEDVETMRGINKILLENILPAHVAEIFLDKRNAQELYHERYNSIAVMFASIPNYKEFYDENDVNKQGLECLRLLNEIICDFDKLLMKPKFSRIEKIKTIGSTYMLAAGLEPGIEDTSGKVSKQQEQSVIALVEFAFALMTILEQINKESFQRFKLRIGLNHGPVIAGVVGAQKPQYDIWGNTVNVASRMDSCGVIGRIQVTEETAKILMNAGYDCECRGMTFVKGKGSLKTYFVKSLYGEK